MDATSNPRHPSVASRDYTHPGRHCLSSRRSRDTPTALDWLGWHVASALVHCKVEPSIPSIRIQRAVQRSSQKPEFGRHPSPNLALAVWRKRKRGRPLFEIQLSPTPRGHEDRRRAAIFNSSRSLSFLGPAAITSPDKPWASWGGSTLTRSGGSSSPT